MIFISSGAGAFQPGRNREGCFMSNLNLEIPAEIRDFAEKTVDQARKAFDSFVAAAQKATAQSEAAAESLTSNAKDVSAKAIGFAEANVKAAFDLADKLVHAKDPKEILSIQSEFLKNQVASVQEQAKALGEAVKKAVTPTESK
jgi:phasin